MIHFVPPHNEKVRAKAPDLVSQVDVVLGISRTRFQSNSSGGARRPDRDGESDRFRLDRLVGAGQRAEFALVYRRHDPARRRDRRQARRRDGAEIEGEWDIHFIDQYLALLEARYGLKRPILVHAILETAQGVNNVEAIAAASPRMHGMSLGRRIWPHRGR